MARNVAIGLQDFEEIVQKNYFYVDKMQAVCYDRQAACS